MVNFPIIIIMIMGAVGGGEGWRGIGSSDEITMQQLLG